MTFRLSRRQLATMLAASALIAIVMYGGKGIVYVPAIAVAAASALLLVATLATRSQS